MWIKWNYIVSEELRNRQEPRVFFEISSRGTDKYPVHRSRSRDRSYADRFGEPPYFPRPLPWDLIPDLSSRSVTRAMILKGLQGPQEIQLFHIHVSSFILNFFDMFSRVEFSMGKRKDRASQSRFSLVAFALPFFLAPSRLTDQSFRSCLRFSTGTCNPASVRDSPKTKS